MAKKAKSCLDVQSSSIAIQIDTNIYPLESAMSAAYHYVDDYYVKFEYDDDGNLNALMRGKGKKSAKALESVFGEFNNNLLAESLRLEIAKRNRKIRETILLQAIGVATGLENAPPQPSEEENQSEMLELDEELRKIIEKTSSMNFEDDPLGISVPITEKEHKKEKSVKPAKAKKNTQAKSAVRPKK